MKVKVEIVPRLKDIPLRFWDVLEIDSVYSTPQWFSMLEQQADVRGRYVLATDGDGDVLGVLPVFHRRRPPSDFYDPASRFVEVLGVRDWWPALAIGNRSTCNRLLMRSGRGDDGQRAVTRAQVEAVRELAGAEGARGTVGMFYSAEEAARLAAAFGDDRSLVLRGGVRGEIEVNWPDFDSYVGSFGRNRRYQTRKELRIVAETGLVFSVQPLAEVLDLVGPLLRNLDRKHGSVDPSRSSDTEAAEYVRHFPDSSLAFLCANSSGDPVGCSVWLRHSDRLYCRSVGFDYSRTSSHEYFSLMFHEPVKYAIAAGISLLDLGLATQAKVRRGAVLTPLYAVLWMPDWDVRHLRERVREWNLVDQPFGLF